MTPAELIRKTAEVYASAPSHAPTDEQPEEGTFCLVYAQCEAEAISKVATEIAMKADRIIQAEVAARGYGKEAVAFNAEHTTEQVLDMLEAAAKRAEAS